MARKKEADRTDYRRHLSDMKAFRYLGNFEMRRVSKSCWGIFMCGTNVRVGTVYQQADQFVRALANTMESSTAPARDRFRRKHEPPKRKYTRRAT